MTTQEVRDKWTAALRSGKYEQGQGQLRTADNKFCCLGVLCDLVDQDGWLTPVDGVVPHTVRANTGYPAGNVRDMVGLTNNQVSDLASMNDIGRSFSEIADHIETVMDSE